jgi:hypothetical protein
MQIHLVTGPGFHVGPGTLVLILEAQVADRRHALDDIRLADGAALAKTTLLQSFIAGEVLGLAELPVGMGGLAEPLTKAPEGTPGATLLAALDRFSALARKDQRDAARAAKAAAREQAEQAARAADEADERRWTDEWNAVELVRRHHEGDLNAFLAAKRAERARMAEEVGREAAAPGAQPV